MMSISILSNAAKAMRRIFGNLGGFSHVVMLLYKAVLSKDVSDCDWGDFVALRVAWNLAVSVIDIGSGLGCGCIGIEMGHA